MGKWETVFSSDSYKTLTIEERKKYNNNKRKNAIKNYKDNLRVYRMPYNKISISASKKQQKEDIEE